MPKSCLNLDGARKAIRDFEKQLLNVINTELAVFQEDVKDEIKQDKSFKGGVNLKARLKYRIEHRRATTSTDINHARFLEYGTRPHVIRARRKKALRFWIGGNKIFAKRVFHPGSKPTYWFSGAHKRAYARFQDNLIDRLSQLSRRF